MPRTTYVLRGGLLVEKPKAGADDLSMLAINWGLIDWPERPLSRLELLRMIGHEYPPEAIP